MDGVKPILAGPVPSKMAKAVYKKWDGDIRFIKNISVINKELLGPMPEMEK